MQRLEVIALIVIASVLLMFTINSLSRAGSTNTIDEECDEIENGKIERMEKSDIGRFAKPCTAPPGYIFLKKHKTASTTFRQLMSHYSKHKGKETIFFKK